MTVRHFSSKLPRGFYVQQNMFGMNKKLMSKNSLAGKTVFVSGGSRGIGLAIAMKAAQDGANVVIAAKTIEAHPKLEGTIYTAAASCQEAGGKAIALQLNLQDEASVAKAVEDAVAKFGGIDILVNSASAIHLQDSESVSMKRYDLMHSINGRGTFMMTKYCIPHLKKSESGHILTLSPPIEALQQPFWFKQSGTAYASAKLAMSMQVVGLSAELQEYGIGVNALWPRTTIATAAVKNLLGGEEMMNKSRTPEIMGDAAHIILTSDGKKNTGNFWIDDVVLAGTGVTDLAKYRVNPNVAEHELVPDFFV